MCTLFCIVFNNSVSYVHAVIFYFKMLINFFVCRNKSPTGLMFHVVYYSTKNKISMSMSLTFMDMWNRALGMLQAGMTQTHVAKQIWTSPTDIHRLSSRFALLVICADLRASLLQAGIRVSIQTLRATYHFLFTCSNYNTQRNAHLPDDLHNYSTNDLLYGREQLSEQDNESLFLRVQEFIVKSERFRPPNS